MFPTRTLSMLVALTLSTSVPLTTVAQAAPAQEAQPQTSSVFHDRTRWIGPDGFGMYGYAADATA